MRRGAGADRLYFALGHLPLQDDDDMTFSKLNSGAHAAQRSRDKSSRKRSVQCGLSPGLDCAAFNVASQPNFDIP